VREILQDVRFYQLTLAIFLPLATLLVLSYLINRRHR
jgi:hypothetical protein